MIPLFDFGNSYTMRAPCKYCGSQTRRATLTVVGGQNVVRCVDCGRANYNAPKDEVAKAEILARRRGTHND